MVRKLRINESEVFGSSGRLTDTCTFKFLNDVDGSDRYTNEKSGSRYRILYKGQPIMQVVNWNEHSDDIDELGTVDVEVMYDADDLPINYISDNFFEQYDSWEDLVDSLKALDKFDKQPSNESLRRINESNDFDDAFIDKLWDACYNVSGLEDIDYDSSSNSNIIFTYGQTTNDYDQREQELISALENSGYNSKYVTNNGSDVIVLRLNAEVSEPEYYYDDKDVKKECKEYMIMKKLKIKESFENENRLYTRKELLNLISSGMGIDADNISKDELPVDYKILGHSEGTYGITGGVIEDNQTGDWYVFTKRTPNLFKIF